MATPDMRNTIASTHTTGTASGLSAIETASSGAASVAASSQLAIPTAAALPTTPTSGIPNSDASNGSSRPAIAEKDRIEPPSIQTPAALPTTPTSGIPNSDASNGSSRPAIAEKDRIPTAIALGALALALVVALLFVFFRVRSKRRRQALLSSAISQTEAGMISAADTGMAHLSELPPAPSPSPTPLPPPPPPPSPIPLSLQRSPSAAEYTSLRPRPYRISTLQIEPMTRRVTMNLGDKGKNIVVRDEADGYSTDHVVNVVTLREEDENDDDDGSASSLSRRLAFWR